METREKFGDQVNVTGGRHKPNKAAEFKSPLTPPSSDDEQYIPTATAVDVTGVPNSTSCARSDMSMIINRQIQYIKDKLYLKMEKKKKPRNQKYMENLMPPQLYRAVTTKNMIDFAHQLPTDPLRDLEKYVFEQSPRGNTVLHIAASIGYDQLAQKILKHYPKLVMIKTSAGNLPFHVAASSGHLSTLQILLDSGEKVNVSDSAGTSSNSNVQLRKKNDDQETALHLALKNGHQQIARMLFDKDPNLTHCKNKEEKSPLYMAAEAGYVELFKAMMEHQDGSDHLVNPDDLMKRKVVHVCIVRKNEDILDILLQKDKWESAFTSVDEKGRNSLSYAALVGYNYEGVGRLLKKFRESSYVADKNGFFPIHMASSKGYIDIIKKFLQHCPHSRELNNDEDQNILHLAAKNGRAKAVTYMLKNPQLEMLINERDCDGNTPLHLATKDSHPKVVSILTWDSRVDLQLINNEGKTALDVAERFSGTLPSFGERLTWLALRHAAAPRALELLHWSTSLVIPINPQNLEPEENNGKQEQTRTPGAGMEFYKDRVNTFLLVATLIVTVTFAAGFSVPGDDDDRSHGMRNWVYKIAFYTYMISNNIAFYSSSTAVVALIWSHLGDLSLAITSLKFALPLLGLALTMLTVAFISGVYLIVSKTIWLAILVVVLGVIATFAILLIFAPLVFPSSSLRPITRSILYYPFHLLIIVTGSDVDHDKDEI